MNQRTRGFTTIEVVLVCAIAGLIFLMAFVALPSLWASQRDADRKALVTEFVSTIKKYQTNNSRGALPTGAAKTATNGEGIKISSTRSSAPNDTSWKALIRYYLPTSYHDPESNNDGSSPSDWIWYVECDQGNVGQPCSSSKLNNTNGDSTPTSPFKKSNNDTRYYTYVVVGAKCGDNNKAVKSANNRDAAVYYILERGGRYCLDV